MVILDIPNENQLRKRLNEDPTNPKNHYFLAKYLISNNPLIDIDLKEVESLLKSALDLSPSMWAPRYYLGILYFKQGRYDDAKKLFLKVLELKPESILTKEYVPKCEELIKSSIPSPPIYKFYSFENRLRKYIEYKLKEKHGDSWWRRAINKDIRKNCVARKEEALDEEQDLNPLYFANFFDYSKIIETNKVIFASDFTDIKLFCSDLNKLSPVRNSIGHSRINHLAESSIDLIIKCHNEIGKIMEKQAIPIEDYSFKKAF